MDTNGAMDKWYIAAIFDVLNLHNRTGFLAATSVLLAAMYAFKCLYFVFQTYMQERVVYGIMNDVQSGLVERFMNHSYTYYLNVNSGEFIRIIGDDTDKTFSLLVIVINFISEFVVAVILSLAIFALSPGITIAMLAVLITMVVLINLKIKPEMKKYGVLNQNSNEGMNKWLLQMIQGVKEIFVFKKKNFFIKKYNQNGLKRTISLSRFQLWRDLPRYVLEACCMGTVFLVIGVVLYNGGNTIESMLPALAAMAMAAVRLFPAVNRMLLGLSQISFYEPMLDRVGAYMKSAQDDEAYIADDTYYDNNVDQKPFSSSIELKNVYYQYPNRNDAVLSDASIKIERGTAVGIIGVSGEGKTTLIDIILGLLEPASGEVLIDGDDIGDVKDGWLSNVGYIPQNIFMLDDNIRANVAFGEEEINDDAVWEALREASLDEFVNSLDDKLDTRIGERGVQLSGGQRQRIGIARALYHNPEVLIFDEATSSLDNKTEKNILETINTLHEQKTIIIIAHRLNTIEFCDYVYRVSDGRIVKER